MKRKIIIPVIAVITVLVVYLLFFANEKTVTNFTFGEVSRGNLHVLITSSGTLEATSTVDVGTQVSGRITKLYVDFNSEVRKGQLIAVIDTTTLAAQVRDAQANLARSEAEYKQKTVFTKKIKLFTKKNTSPNLI